MCVFICETMSLGVVVGVVVVVERIVVTRKRDRFGFLSLSFLSFCIFSLGLKPLSLTKSTTTMKRALLRAEKKK